MCESRLHSLQDAQTSLASHSFALPLYIEKVVNFWMETQFFHDSRERTLERQNGGFPYRLEDEKRFSTVLIVKLS